jgi:hypothetical protein
VCTTPHARRVGPHSSLHTRYILSGIRQPKTDEGKRKLLKRLQREIDEEDDMDMDSDDDVVSKFSGRNMPSEDEGWTSGKVRSTYVHVMGTYVGTLWALHGLVCGH